MRKLTLSPRMGDASIRLVEESIASTFSENFKDFMKENGGLSHFERYFIDKENTQWEVNSYCNFTELYKLTEEFLKSYHRKLVPFAFDAGGWHFCLCIEEKDYGTVIINRWTDYLPEEQFLKIADSFEDFINGLKTEEEIG